MKGDSVRVGSSESVKTTDADGQLWLPVFSDCCGV